MQIRHAWAILLTAFTGLAATFYPQAFPEAVQGTPVIVRGKVGMSYSDYGRDPDGNTRLYTYYEVTVSEVFKGGLAAPSIMIRELGGEKDGVAMNVSGTAQFKRGEDTVVFLREGNSDGSYDVQGMMMGKYPVDTDPEEFILGSDGKKWRFDEFRQLIRTQETHPAAPPASATKPPAPVPQLQPTSSAETPKPGPEVVQPSAPQKSIWIFAVLATCAGALASAWYFRKRK